MPSMRSSSLEGLHRRPCGTARRGRLVEPLGAALRLDGQQRADIGKAFQPEPRV